LSETGGGEGVGGGVEEWMKRGGAMVNIDRREGEKRGRDGTVKGRKKEL
jgi:hypothetical protein